MPFPIATQNLIQMEKLPQDMYRLLALDEDISDRQRQQRDRRAELIAPLMVEECICDKSYRNKVLREIVSTLLPLVKLFCNTSGCTGFTSPKMRCCLLKNPTPKNALCQQTKRPSVGR